MGRRSLQSALLLFVVFLLASGPIWPAMPVREAPEYAVKAAYLLLFCRYVEWPANAFASPAAPVEILVLGDDPFGDVLDTTVAGMKSNGREIVVRRARTLEPGARSHLVFFGAVDANVQSQWLTQLRHAPILTVVDDASALEHGAVIAFVTEFRRGEARVRFDVNLGSMRRAGVRINSQMLSSARRVVREPASDPVAGR